jgi:hypothetical protein
MSLQMESTVVREGEVYGVLWRNRVNTKMSYPLMSSEGAIEIWMRELESCTTEMVDEAMRFLNLEYLRKLPCPAHIWDFQPRDRMTWTLIWQHYVYKMLGLPNVCYIEQSTTSLVFPEHIATLVEEFFREPDDRSEPNGSDAVPSVA